MKHESLNDKSVSHEYESELNLLNFFDNPNDPTPKVPNDDEREHSTGDGNVMAYHDVNMSHPVDENETFATPLNEHVNNSKVQQSDLIPHRFNNESLSSTNFGDEPQTARRSERVRNLSPKYNDYILPSNKKYGIEKHVNYSKLFGNNICFASNLNKSCEPKSFKEVILDKNWIEAMNNEMEALFRNKTWILVDLPPNRKTIGCKWLWKIKYKSTGEIERYKARLVAKGFSQRDGIDYEKTFSLVVKMVTVRCVISLAVHNNWPLFQLDVNNAFLYGDLHEDVYMDLPPGYYDSSETKVFYVDDIVVTGNNIEEISKFKSFLASKFHTKDLGSLKYFLGIEVLENKHGLCLSQRKYCLELLSEYGLLACQPAATPMQQNVSLSHKETAKDKRLINITTYQKLVGKLIYLSVTRPDISYDVHCLSQHMHAPLKSHFSASLRVLRYLKQSPGLGVQSVSGFCVYFCGNLVSWKSMKQATISKSSAEAKYRCLASITCEVLWIVNLLEDLGVEGMLPVLLYCDSTSTIQIAANPVFHEKTKHIEINVHLVREKVALDAISTVKIDSAKNIADVFTKGLSITQHKQFCLQLNLVDMFKHTWHQRLGHPGREVLRHLVSNNLISCNKEKPLVLCHACQLGKHVRLPFFVWVYPLLNKSDVWSKFVLFRTYVHTQFQCEIRSFQYDHGGEFDNRHFHKLFAENGIQFCFSCPKTSQQNDGTLSRYKARLVANGSTQLEGVDVDETFSLVIKPVYMHQPPGFQDTVHPDYGTDTAYLLLFVDDIVLTASSERLLQQKKYAIEILDRAHMVNCNPSRTPIDTESKLGSDGDPVSDPTLYRSLAGSLQYLTFTRLDISYAVQQVCLYMHDPREPYFSALKRILRYVRGTLDYGLQLFSSFTTDLVAYSDADWDGCPTTRRSTSGYCVFLGNNLLSWSSKRQPTLSRSSVEAEYRGVANAVAETCWLRNLLRELHTPLSSATLVYCDNVSAVYLSCNPVQHQRTKHIEINIHFVRDLVAAGQVRVLHVPSRYQFADIFTKGLPSALFEEFRSSLSVRCPPAPTAREC
ncbi:ribonuclease H-like domain-containing protein [Tanacetum coccineum]